MSRKVAFNRREPRNYRHLFIYLDQMTCWANHRASQRFWERDLSYAITPFKGCCRPFIRAIVARIRMSFWKTGKNLTVFYIFLSVFVHFLSCFAFSRKIHTFFSCPRLCLIRGSTETEKNQYKLSRSCKVLKDFHMRPENMWLIPDELHKLFNVAKRKNFEGKCFFVFLKWWLPLCYDMKSGRWIFVLIRPNLSVGSRILTDVFRYNIINMGISPNFDIILLIWGYHRI